MKRLALIFMLLTLSFSAQAQDYEETKTLYCKSSDTIWEIFVLDGEWISGIYKHKHEGWTVKGIFQYESFIEVRLDGPGGETLWIDFNNGYPCKIEIRRKPIQPESDNFDKID